MNFPSHDTIGPTESELDCTCGMRPNSFIRIYPGTSSQSSNEPVCVHQLKIDCLFILFPFMYDDAYASKHPDGPLYTSAEVSRA